MVQLSKLFWQSYPKLYRRFGDITGAPENVTLAIENEGYAIAEAGGDHVHIHDQWLNSDFAWLSSYAEKGERSPLLKKYDIRRKADALAAAKH